MAVPSRAIVNTHRWRLPVSQHVTVVLQIRRTFAIIELTHLPLIETFVQVRSYQQQDRIHPLLLLALVVVVVALLGWRWMIRHQG